LTSEFDVLGGILRRFEEGKATREDLDFLEKMVDCLHQFDHASDHFTKPVPYEMRRNLNRLTNEWRRKIEGTRGMFPSRRG